MTPPDANIEKQKRRHRPMLYVLLAAIVIFVVGSLIMLSTPLSPEIDDGARSGSVEG